MNKYNISILVFFIILLLACKKDLKMNTREHPVIITKEVTEINSTGVTLNAELTELGQDEIIDYGFIITSENAEYKYSIIEETSIKQFNKRVLILEERTEYTCRAYVKTSKHTIFANVVSFFSNGSSSPIFPKIENYTPNEGHDNTSVTINGEYFNLFSGEKSVTVNNIEAQIISWEDNYIEFITPEMPFFGDTKIELNFGDVTINIDYKVFGPEFNSFSNTSGHSGSLVKISGNNFFSDTKVLFNDYEAEVIYQSDTLIELLVPAIRYFSQLFNDFSSPVSIKTGLKTLNINDHFLIKKSWTEKSTPPYEESLDNPFFTYNNSAFMFFGEKQELWIYKPESNVWSFVSEFLGNGVYGSTFIVNENKVHKLGGYYPSSGGVKYHWVFDFNTNIWTQKDDIPYTLFNGTYFFVKENEVIIVTNNAQCWKFNIVDLSFNEMNIFPETLSIHDFSYTFTNNENNYVVTNSNIWLYKPDDDIWESVMSHSFHGDGFKVYGFAYNNKPYVLYGRQLFKYFQEYNNWYQVSNFPSSHNDQVSIVAIKNKAYFVTGENHYVAPGEMFMYEE